MGRITSVIALLNLLMLLCIGVVGASEAPNKFEAAYNIDFDSAEPLKGWDNCKYARVETDSEGNKFLQVDVPKDQGRVEDYEKKGSIILSYKLDPKKIAGKMVFIFGDIKADGVTKPSVGWLGIKLALHYSGPGGKQWKHPNDLYGSFDWKEMNAYCGEVPEDITAANIYIGLQESTGKVAYDNIRLMVSDVPPDDPSFVQKELFKWHDVPRLRGLEVNKFKVEQAGSTTDDGHDWNPYVISKLWKANVIRYQMSWPEFYKMRVNDDPKRHDLNAYNAWLDEELVRIDKLLEDCKKNDLYVVLNVYTWPGGEMFFKDVKYQDRLVEIWQMLARRYKDNEAVIGFDILNEPFEDQIEMGKPRWQQVVERAAKAIREIDEQTPIIVECTDRCNPAGFAELRPIPVKRVVYSVHMYYHGKFTHQGVVSVIGEQNKDKRYEYPGMIDGEMWDKERLRLSFEPVRKFQLKYNVPIFVGEFSAIRWAPGESSYRWLKDVIEIYEEYDWDWCYHAFREYHGWSVEHGPDINNTKRVDEPTSREKLLKEWFAKNKVPDLSTNK